jgi:drug/metabolite transporter (DMT)-like permease
MSIAYWCLLFAGILSSAVGGLLLKMGSVEIDHAGVWQLFHQSFTNWKIILGLSFYVLPMFIWIFMLKKMDLSFLQPMFSLVYVVTPILAFVVLHENIPLNRWIGIGIIIVGVFFVARG